MRRGALLSTRNPCGEVLLEGTIVSTGNSIEDHSRADIAGLGIRAEDGPGLFPGRMVVQRRNVSETHVARCGTVVAADNDNIAVLWGDWLPDPGPDADIVAGIAAASKAIQALGRQCDSAGKALSLFVRTRASSHDKTRR